MVARVGATQRAAVISTAAAVLIFFEVYKLYYKKVRARKPYPKIMMIIY
jgi:hypothetical protein